MLHRLSTRIFQLNAQFISAVVAANTISYILFDKLIFWFITAFVVALLSIYYLCLQNTEISLIKKTSYGMIAAF
jgi:hypothetical protein